MRGRFPVAALLGLALSQLGVAASAAQETLPHADLAIVSNTPSMRHAKVGEVVTFTIMATNDGPDTVELDVLAAGPQIVPNDPSLALGPIICNRVGVCYYVVCDRALFPYTSADATGCEFSDVQPGEAVVATIAFEVQASGNKYGGDTGCVTSFAGPYTDPDPTNDCATATVRIVGRRK